MRMSGVSLAPSNGRKMDRIRMFVALVNGVECFPAPQDEPFLVNVSTDF